MKKQQKSLYAGFVVLIIAALAMWFFGSKQGKTPAESANNSKSSTSPSKNTPTSTPSASSSTWTGTLKASDNNQKGNLMLVTPERSIYLRTSRDYSSLLNKEVVVTYEGSLNSFVLKDIQAK